MLYNFYDLFVENGLLEDLYAQELLSTLTVSAIAIAFLVAFAFYIWPLNKVSFSGFGHWLTMLLVSGGLMFVVTLVTCMQMANREIERVPDEPDQGFFFDQGGTVFFSFSAEMAVLTFLLFFLISMLMKGFSRNAKHRPMLWPSK